MLITLAKRKLLWSTGAFLCMASFWVITPETPSLVEPAPNTSKTIDSKPSQPSTKRQAQPVKASVAPKTSVKYVSGLINPVETPGSQKTPYVVGMVIRTVSPAARQIPTLITDYLIRNSLRIFETTPEDEIIANPAMSQDSALALHDALSRDSGYTTSPVVSVVTGVAKQHNPVAKKVKKARSQLPGGQLI